MLRMGSGFRRRSGVPMAEATVFRQAQYSCRSGGGRNPYQLRTAAPSEKNQLAFAFSAAARIVSSVAPGVIRFPSYRNSITAGS
jgi:hypothetical protein